MHHGSTCVERPCLSYLCRDPWNRPTFLCQFPISSSTSLFCHQPSKRWSSFSWRHVGHWLEPKASRHLSVLFRVKEAGWFGWPQHGCSHDYLDGRRNDDAFANRGRPVLCSPLNSSRHFESAIFSNWAGVFLHCRDKHVFLDFSLVLILDSWLSPFRLLYTCAMSRTGVAL